MNLENKVEIYKNREDSIANAGHGDRYIIVEGSETNHCCFECTIIDTKMGKKSHGDSWVKNMCESLETEDAVLICAALNKYDKSESAENSI